MRLEDSDLDEVLRGRRPLPDLKDDLDEFFREVELSPLVDFEADIKEERMNSDQESKFLQHSQIQSKIPISAMLNAPFQRPVAHSTNLVSLFQDQFKNDMFSLSDDMQQYKELAMNFDGTHYKNNDFILVKKPTVH